MPVSSGQPPVYYPNANLSEGLFVAPNINGPVAPQSAPFIPHLTLEGERLDSIAWKYYGDATLFGPIVAANFGRGVLVPVFPAGVAIKVPLLVSSGVQQNDLPPWKRG
jgi:phage tail protein X